MLTEEEYDTIARSDCFVCRIVQGKPLIPDVKVVYEDEAIIAFLNQRTPQEGYTLVCPKTHVERFEDMAPGDWLKLQAIVQKVAKAVAVSTNAMRMYIASLGSPERNAHLHIHVCPCPPGTPFDKQQFAIMNPSDARYLEIRAERMSELANSIRSNMA